MSHKGYHGKYLLLLKLLSKYANKMLAVFCHILTCLFHRFVLMEHELLLNHLKFLQNSYFYPVLSLSFH